MQRVQLRATCHAHSVFATLAACMHSPGLPAPEAALALLAVEHELQALPLVAAGQACAAGEREGE